MKLTSQTNVNRDTGPGPARERKRLWYVNNEGDVYAVVGYSCAPSNPDYWWVPREGFSGAINHHLFEQEADALKQATRVALFNLKETTRILCSLEARRRKLE